MENRIYVDGKRQPTIGYHELYFLDGVFSYHSIMWEVYKDNTLSRKLDFDNSQSCTVVFLNPSAGNSYTLRARYKETENSTEKVAEMDVSPKFGGSPNIAYAGWQGSTGGDICTMEKLSNARLAVLTTNMPPGHSVSIEIIAKGVQVEKKTVKINNTGRAYLDLSIMDWRKFKAHLIRVRKIGIFTNQISYQIKASYTDYVANQVKTFTSANLLAVTYSDPRTQYETAAKSAVIGNSETGSDAGEETKEKIDLTINVYFDGTAGNRDNIDNMHEAIDAVMHEKYGMRRPLYEMSDSDSWEDDDIKMAAYRDDLAVYEKEVKAKILDNDDNLKKVKEHIGQDPKDSSISYNQVYTNIPYMFDLNQIDNYIAERQIKVYIEGVGSRTGGDDDVITGSGSGMDTNGTGLPSKVKRAMEEITKELRKTFRNNRQNILFNEVKVTVCGFSRGAATTRYFVSHRNELAKTLGVPAAQIRYTFVGIFDTVCSVTDLEKLGIYMLAPLSPLLTAAKIAKIRRIVTEHQRHNVKEFKLAMGSSVEKVVHLTAADEYRVFFPLTDISSSIASGGGYELELPGTHCDIGGGDIDNMFEYVEEDKLVVNRPKFIDRLVKEGWYYNTDISTEDLASVPSFGSTVINFNPTPLPIPIPVRVPSIKKTGIYKRYRVERTIREGYQKIPLSIMMHFAGELGQIEHDSSKVDKTHIPELLQRVGAKMLKFAKDNYGAHKVSAVNTFNGVDFENLRPVGLRRDYLHMSAYPENGGALMSPAPVKDMANRSDIYQIPKREVFNG